MSQFQKPILFVILALIIEHTYAQQSPSFLANPTFMMSSVGNFNVTANHGPALVLKSNETCIDVQSGLAVIRGIRGNGQFAMNCEVVLNFNNLGIRLYPNPVDNSTKVQFANTPPFNKVFNLSIWSVDGLLISNKKESGYDLFQGVNINIGDISPGTYFLKLESVDYNDVIKFIKAK